MARAPQVERREHRMRHLPTVVGSGGDVHRAAAHAFGGLSNQLQTMGRQAQAKATATAKAAGIRTASKTGAAAGKAAQQSGQLTLLPDDTDENRAHNAALTRSYFREVELTGRRGLADIEAQWAHDPAEMSQRMQAFASGLRGGVPADLQTDMDVLMETLSRPFIRNAQRQQRAAVLAADQAQAAEQLDARLDDLDRIAFLSDLDPQSDVAIGGQIDGLTQLLVEQGPKTAFSVGGIDYPADPGRTGVMDPDAIGGQIRDAVDRAGLRRIEGAFSRLSSEGEQRAFAQRLDTEFKSGTGVIGALSPDHYQSLKARVAKSLDGFERERRGRATEVRSRLRDAAAVVANGLNPGDDTIRRLRSDALRTGDASLVSEVQALEGRQSFAQTLDRQTPESLRGFIEQTRGSSRSVSREQSDRVKIAERYLSGMETALSRDPLGFAAETGRMDVVALDFAAPDLSSQAMQRKFQALVVADEFGIDPPLLRPDERKELAARLQAGGREALATAQSVMAAFGEDGAKVLGEVSDAAPPMAHLSALPQAGADPVFIEDAAIGLELMAGDGFKSRLPERSVIDAAVEETFDTAFAALPGAGLAVRDSALAALEARAARQGGSIDEGTVKSVLQTALGRTHVNRSLLPGRTYYGGTTRVRGQTVIAPTWLEAKRLDETVDRLSDDQWAANPAGAPRDADGEILSAEDLSGLHMVSVGNGRYRMSFNAPYGPDPQYLLDEGGHAYVLDLQALEPMLRQDPRIRGWMRGAD